MELLAEAKYIAYLKALGTVKCEIGFSPKHSKIFELSYISKYTSTIIASEFGPR
jgi:hypothetical protein